MEVDGSGVVIVMFGVGISEELAVDGTELVKSDAWGVRVLFLPRTMVGTLRSVWDANTQEDHGEQPRL